MRISCLRHPLGLSHEARPTGATRTLRRAPYGLLALAIALAPGALGCEDGPRERMRGEPCAADSACAGLTCVFQADDAPLDLEPALFACDDAAPGKGPGEACDLGGDCDHGMCLLAGACALPCELDDDCGERQRCQAVFLRASSSALQPSMACVSAVDLPDGTDVHIERAAQAIEAGQVEITLGAAPHDGAESSASIYVLEHLDPDFPGSTCRPPLCVHSLRSDGEPAVLYDAELDYSVEAAPRAAVLPGDHADPVTFRIDAELARELDGAALQLTLESEQPGDLQITRVHRLERGQRLDLNVFYLGALDWVPTGARGPELLEAALEVVDDILAPADIFIGEVRQIAVPGALPERGVAFEPEGDTAAGFERIEVRYGVYMELPELFRLSAGAGNSAINLFFVRDIAPRVGGEPEAQAGGVPGPPAMHGTAGSGIAISTDMMSGDASSVGRTLAHELAHYMGLFHLSEEKGSVFEPLEDTPECRPGDDCTGMDSNLMWWARASGTELSPDQIEVLRSAPMLQ